MPCSVHSPIDDRRSKDVSSTSDDVDRTLPPKDEQSPYRGLVFTATASIFFSSSSVIVKYADNIYPGQLAIFRFLGILFLTLPLSIHSQHYILGPKDVRQLLVLRGIVGSSNLFLNFIAFRYLPIADASVIICSLPVFVSALARLWLREQCGLFQLASIFLTICGIVLIAKLPELFLSDDQEHSASFTSEHLVGLLAALGSLLFRASVYVVIRRLKHVHYSIIMLHFGWVAILETTFLTALMGDFALPSCGIQRWLALALGVCSFVGQNLITRALQCEQAGPVSTVRAAADIVLAFFWQVTIFHDIPDGYSICGAVLISSSVILIGLRKWVMTLPEECTTRKRMHFLTL